MQKQEAITIIENTFSAAFDEANFTLFVKNLLNDLDTTKYNHYAGNLIKDAYRKHVKQYKRIGKYTDPNGDAMDVLIVEVTDQYHLDHARTSLRNFVITHLDSFEKDYALVAFYSHSDGGADWRFSFVKLEYKTKVNEGKIKQEKELTPAKRYSFLVGEHEKAHTAKKQLLPLLENIYNNPTIEELEGAFSIEAVTDEFFEQYKTLFVSLTEQFEQNHQLKTELAAAGIEIPRFTKKLLGQIVFLYFLQKKGWMGVPKDQKWGTGEKRFLQKLFDEAIENGKNFFGDYLQFLFYEALAHKHNDEGIQGFYAPLNCKVPFLNGGLFEADYDWENDHIAIPNELFRNTEKIGKSGDIGSGVLDVFDRYNFTIKEDEPLEKEVAVDPEMLGKVFENMLEVTERKSKGAFYTPREIVHYMCQESLIHYLDNAVNTYSKTYQELGNSQIKMFGNEVKKDQQSIMFEKESIRIPKEDIETYIRKGFFTLENDQRVISEGRETRTYQFKLPETIRYHAELLDQKLSKIRVCDPAIGSGAFPVGMLHEIVNARLVLKPHLKNQDNQVNPINQGSDYAYYLKRHTIQECIYGVDIDASAIDIARLRLWLSLVVDEEDLDTIEALPNLDYKIVCGNSLIGLPETAMRDLAVEKELEGLKDEFFKETDEDHKKELRTEINTKIRQLLDSAEQFAGYKIDFDFKLFFSEVWHEKGGFDVVIGNPPYISYYGRRRTLISNELDRYFKNHYHCIVEKKHAGKYNSMMLFQEKALWLSSNKGIQSYIIDVSFFENFYSGIKKMILDKTSIKIVIKGLSSFQNVASGQLILITNKNKQINNQVRWFEDDFNMFKEVDQKIWINPENSYQFFLPNSNIVSALTDEIEKKSQPISNFFTDKLIRTGESVGVKESGFVIDSYPDDCEKEIYEYLEGGKSLKGRYEKLVPTRYFIYDIELLNEKNLAYRKEALLSGRVNSKVLGIGDKLAFDNPKILVRQSSPIICASYTTKKYIYNRSYYSISQLNSSGKSSVDLLYTLAFLNSSVLTFYAINKGLIKAEKGKQPQIRLEDLKKLPLCIVNTEIQQKIQIFVSFILYSKEIGNLLISQYLIDVVDAIIFEVFFESQLNQSNKSILKHLGGLKPITENMSPEQKLAIIQSEFERLYDPNHPVRNNVETLDSVEEVRIIREALK